MRAAIPLAVLTAVITAVLILVQTPLASSENIEIDVKFCKEATPAGEIGIVGFKSSCNEKCDAHFLVVDNVYCNADENNFRVECRIEGSTIYITFIFDDRIATRCVCPVTAGMDVRGLEKKNYTVVYVFDNRYVGEKKVVERARLVFDAVNSTLEIVY